MLVSVLLLAGRFYALSWLQANLLVQHSVWTFCGGGIDKTKERAPLLHRIIPFSIVLRRGTRAHGYGAVEGYTRLCSEA